jgi:hypothetical protein
MTKESRRGYGMLYALKESDGVMNRDHNGKSMRT